MPETIEFSGFHLKNEFQLYYFWSLQADAIFQLEDADHSKTP